MGQLEKKRKRRLRLDRRQLNVSRQRDRDFQQVPTVDSSKSVDTFRLGYMTEEPTRIKPVGSMCYPI